MDHATMDHGSMTMTMPVSTTMTGSAAAATTTAAMAMGGMDHGDGGMGGGCKISMLWNWNTIDSCFISSSWHVTSTAMFAGSCIGTVLLVVALEFLRRAVKEYDAFLLRQHRAALAGHTTATNASPGPPKTTATASSSAPASPSSEDLVAAAAAGDPGFRPNVLQQAVRAFLHMLQFAVAYFVMLLVPFVPCRLWRDGMEVPVTPKLTGRTSLAMYYNGYIIICIFIGAFLGAFIFQWEKLGR